METINVGFLVSLKINEQQWHTDNINKQSNNN